MSDSFHHSVDQISDNGNQENFSETIYNLSTLTENNLIYDNTTIENNTSENDVHAYENVHENHSSMSA